MPWLSGAVALENVVIAVAASKSSRVSSRAEYNKKWRTENKEKLKEYNNEYHKKWYLKNKEKIKAATAKWAKANKQKVNANARQWRKENSQRNSHYKTKHFLRTRYNLTLEEWRLILESQNNCCAICRADNSNSKNNWHTDHDHVTGKVRGILCHHCNSMLGYAKDNKETLLAAVEYLERQCLKS